jgi:hypothetical protein
VADITSPVILSLRSAVTDLSSITAQLATRAYQMLHLDMTGEAVNKRSATLGHVRHNLSRIAAFAKVVAEYYAAANDQQRTQAAPFI